MNHLESIIFRVPFILSFELYCVKFRVRSQKNAADGCDFTYAPTGPGKSKKQKGGDEGLAYKVRKFTIKYDNEVFVAYILA